jgi:hypothetical protein
MRYIPFAYMNKSSSSGPGQYLVAHSTLATRGVQLNNNFGNTSNWSYNPISNLSGLSINDVGKTVITDNGIMVSLCERNNYVIHSNDGGQNWSQFTNIADPYAYDDVSISDDGQYITILQNDRNKFYYSTDYGATFNVRNVSIRLTKVAIGSGPIQFILSTYGGNTPSSPDYIYKFNTTDNTLTPLTNLGSRIWYDISVSSNNQNILGSYQVGGSYINQNVIISKDGGTTLTTLTITPCNAPFAVLSRKSTYIFTNMINSGVEYYKVSNNLGTTWTNYYIPGGDASLGKISSDGKVLGYFFTNYSDITTDLYISQNNGSTVFKSLNHLTSNFCCYWGLSGNQ